MASAGQGNMRLITDFSGERLWTLVAEFETLGMAEFEKMMPGGGVSESDTKEMGRIPARRPSPPGPSASRARDLHHFTRDGVVVIEP